jgi:predicted nucleic acid-binding Zn ribbon protein
MERLGDEVRRSLSSAGVPDAGVLADVVRVWPVAVGETVARFAWPARIGRDGALHVATASSTWAFELTRMAGEVRAKLAAELGDDTPCELRFAPGPIPAPGPDPEGSEERPQAPRPALEDEREAASLAAAIGDEELRETVRRAAVASLASRRSGRSFW